VSGGGGSTPFCISFLTKAMVTLATRFALNLCGLVVGIFNVIESALAQGFSRRLFGTSLARENRSGAKDTLSY
jgi:hypothetical protein